MILLLVVYFLHPGSCTVAVLLVVIVAVGCPTGDKNNGDFIIKNMPLLRTFDTPVVHLLYACLHPLYAYILQYVPARYSGSVVQWYSGLVGHCGLHHHHLVDAHRLDHLSP